MAITCENDLRNDYVIGTKAVANSLTEPSAEIGHSTAVPAIANATSVIHANAGATGGHSHHFQTTPKRLAACTP